MIYKSAAQVAAEAIEADPNLNNSWLKDLLIKGEAYLPSMLQPQTARPGKGRQPSIDAATSITNVPAWIIGIAYHINEERRYRGEPPSNDLHVLLGSTKWWAQERIAILACMIDQTPNPPPNIREKGRRIEHHLKWMKQ